MRETGTCPADWQAATHGPVPKDWEVRRLDQMAEILDHMRVPISTEERSRRLGVVPYYGANGHQGWIDDFLFDEALILIAEDGGNFDDFATRGIAYRVSGKSWVNNHAHVLRASNGNSLDFLFFTLAHRDIRRYIAGSTRSKLTQRELRSIELAVPLNAAEQFRIAAVLDTVDQAIAKTEAVIAKLEQVRAGLLHDLFTRGLDENSQLRDPVAHPEQFQDSPLGRVPRDWDVVTAHATCVLITKGTTPPSAAFANNDRAARYLRVDNLTFSGSLDLSLPPLFIDYTTHRTILRRSVVLEGDVLMNIVGPPLGKVAVVPRAEHEWNVNQAIAIFRASDGITPNFLATWLLSRGAQDWLWQRAKQTSGQVNLTLEMCSELPVPVPKQSEQSRILDVLRSVDAQISIEHKSLQKAQQLKQGLMNDLLTGRVRVPEGFAVSG